MKVKSTLFYDIYFLLSAKEPYWQLIASFPSSEEAAQCTVLRALYVKLTHVPSSQDNPTLNPLFQDIFENNHY